MADIQSNIKFNIDTSDAMASIKALQSQISAFQTQMAKGSAANAREAKNLQRTLIDNINATNKFAASVTSIKTTTESFTTSLEKNKLSLREYFRYAGGASKSFGKLFTKEFETINKVARERVKDLQTQYIQLGRDANGAMQAIKIRPLVLDMDNLATKTAIAAQRQQLLNQLLKQGSTNLLNFGKNTQWAGRQLMVGFTIPLGILGQTAIKTFMDMEQQAIKFKRVYGDLFTTTQETNKALKDIRGLATEFTKYGVAASKTMELAAQAAATGKTGAELMAQVNQANRLAVLGNVEQQQALETTMSLTNAFGVSADKLAQKINFLNAVENQTVTSIEDLTTAIPKAGPVIKQLGGNVEDLAFFLTAMREGGINASEGANALKSGLAALINPTAKASDMLAGFGINIKKIVEANRGNVKGLVLDFSKALDTLDPLNRARAIEQLFGKFQFSRLSTLFQNVVKEGSQASRVLELTAASSTQLAALANSELKKLSDSPMYKFQKAVEDIKVQLAPVGEEFLKAITPIIQFGTDVLKAFNNLDGGVKQFIVNLTGIVGGIGPILLMTFGLLANGAANIIKLFALMKSGFNNLGKTSNDLASQTSYLTTEQIQASSVAASLDQVHSKLRQTFTLEASALDQLTAAYQRNIVASGMRPGMPSKRFANGGIVRGPGGPKDDLVPANLSNGEAVIDAATVKKNPRIIGALFAGKKIQIPGYKNNNGTEFAHIGERQQQGALSAYSQISQNPDAVSGRARRILEGLANAFGDAFKVNVLGKLGITTGQTSSGQSINNLLDKTGVPTDEFMKDWDKQGLKRWSRSVKYAGLKFDDVADELTILDKEMKTQIELMNLKTIKDRDILKAYDRASKVVGSSGTVIPAFNRLQNTAGEIRANLSQTWVNQGGFPDAPGGGSRGAVTVNGMKVRKQGDRFSFYTKQGFAIVKNAMDGVVEGVKRATRQASPSKEARQAGEMIGRGSILGIKDASDDARAAGQALGNAATNGIVTGGQSGTARRAILPEQPFIPSGTQSGSVGKNNRPGLLARAKATIQGLKSTDAEVVKGAKESAGRGITKGGFGIGAVAGVASMFAPPEMQGILGAVSSVSTIVGMFGNSLGKVVPLLLRFAGPIGIAITAVSALAFVFGELNKAAKEREKNEKAFSNASKTSTQALETAANFFGTTLGTAPGSTARIGTNVSAINVPVAQQLLGQTDFKKENATQIDAIKRLNAKDAEAALAASAANFASRGFGEDAVQTMVDAMLIAAGRTDVKLDFKSINVATKKGRAGQTATVAGLIQDQAGKIKTARESFGGNGMSKTTTYLDATYTPVEQTISNKARTQAIVDTAQNVAPQFQALQQAYSTGAITLDQYNSQFATLVGEMERIPQITGDVTDKFSVMQNIIKNINPEVAKFTAGIKNTQDQALVLQATLMGLAIPEGVLRNLASSVGSERFRSGGNNGKIVTSDPKKSAREYIKKMMKEAKKARDEALKEMGLDGTDGKDALNAKLKLIGQLEDKINKKYEARKKALEQINKIQEQISQQQQQQLDLADAISRGDIASAARAAQQMRATNAANQIEAQGVALESQRQKAIGAIRVGGMSRAEIESKLGKMSTGGLVPSYFANGGFAMGTDTVPAMLTPGEFVIRKSAVDRIGVGNLNKINGYANGGEVKTGNSSANSMYNSYSINLSVNSNSDADAIANKVMDAIRRVESQNIRSNRF